MKKIILLAFVYFLSSTRQVNSQSDIFSKTRALVQNSKWDEIIATIDKEIDKATTDRELMLFQKAYSYFQLKDFKSAEEVFSLLRKEKNVFQEYTLYFLGIIYYNQNNYENAKNAFNLILKVKPNLKLKSEAMFYLSQMALSEEKYQQSFELLTKLEKTARGTEQYPEILYQLATIETKLKKHTLMCKHALKLYVQFPQFEKISLWSYDLSLNQLNNQSIQCKWDEEDFRKRVKSSLWAGLSKKAYEEIIKFKADGKGKNDFEGDKILASFFAQEGNLDESYGILKKYLKENENDFEFLTQFGTIAARVGDLPTSISSYYKAYQLNKKLDKNQQALFQAAFMSYQVQDYDWATRKFRDFLKVSRNEKLKKDTQWYLAWMSYLRGDHAKSYLEFKKLSATKNKKKYRSLSQERLNYWIGMSLYRQNKLDKAKIYFEKLSLDKQRGYYSIAAQKRLEKILLEIKAAAPVQSYKIPTRISRFQMEEFLSPSNEEVILDDESLAENEEIEEETDPFEPTPVVEVVSEVDEVPFKTPELIQRFEKARALMILGLDQWSKWDLYEIEKRTKNKDYLKVLMNEYSMVGQYHRLSHISQVYFNKQKSQLGLVQGKQFWEYSFPRAYPQYVDKYSKEFEVSRELVWSIMRAESQYRKEAISPVGALGLMQVMPYTGNKIAEILGDKQFNPRQLLDAEPAIKIGTKYLQRLNRKFNQALPLVAASYNAGPHRVKNWIQLFGNLETDEFIEHIPFLETRNYVKSVITNSYIYSQLYLTNGNSKIDHVPFLSGKLPYVLKERASTKETWEEI